MLRVGSNRERVPRLCRVFDSFRIATIKVIVLGAHVTDVASGNDKEPGRRLLVSVQVGELGDAVINRTAEGQGIERG